MTNLGDLRRQHEAAEDMAATIVAKIDSYRDQYDAAAIAILLRKLAALLRLHFAVEDSVLYPTVMKKGSREAATLAWEFHEEMGDLALRFEDFARRWAEATMIADDFDEFEKETALMLSALGARIERENDQLFPLAERAMSIRAV